MTKRKQTPKKILSIEKNSETKTAETSTERGDIAEAAASEPDALKPFNYAGILVANETRPAEKGTLGGVLMSDKGVLYGITCFHAVKQNNKDFSKIMPDESLKVISENGKEIGIFTENTAFINAKLDIALIKLFAKFHNKTIDSPTKCIDVSDADIGTEVYYFNDRNKAKVKGVIRKINQKGNWRLGKYEEIIFVSTVLDEDACQNITEEGDSGSWLLRVSDNALVGVIFANSYRHTFVMPITTVIKAFQKKDINLSLNLSL
jgi:hypothetical protein